MRNGFMSGTCKYNTCVLCDKIRCESACGWNPGESLRRHQQLKKKGLTQIAEDTYQLRIKREAKT